MPSTDNVIFGDPEWSEIPMPAPASVSEQDTSRVLMYTSDFTVDGYRVDLWNLDLNTWRATHYRRFRVTDAGDINEPLPETLEPTIQLWLNKKIRQEKKAAKERRERASWWWVEFDRSGNAAWANSQYGSPTKTKAKQEAMRSIKNWNRRRYQEINDSMAELERNRRKLASVEQLEEN